MAEIGCRPDQGYRYMRLAILSAVVVTLVGTAGFTPAAHAQELSAAERQAAAEAAYDRGTRAYRGGDYAQAARWYETANELAPAAAAALQAVRAHQRAGNHLRAGTVAADVQAQYGERRLGQQAAAIERATRDGFRVDVRCVDGDEEADCRLEVNGELEVFRSLFLPADVEQRLVAIFEGGRRAAERVNGPAGERREITLTAPRPEPIVEPPLGDGDGHAEVRPPDDREGPGPEGPRVTPEPPGGISPAVFIMGLVLTAGVGALAAWSWLDTLSAADAYEMMPTRAGLDDGRALELRTDLLLGGTALLGVVTLVTLFFTRVDSDAEGESDGSTEVALSPLPEGGLSVSARGSF